MNVALLVQAKRQDILQIAQHYGASNVRVFGSVARGESNQHSDIDLLIDLAPERGLLDLVALWQDLEDLLGCEVDVVTERALKTRMRERVLDETVAL